MRNAFIQELTAQARVHPEIFLVVGDLGYSVVEPFAKEFPGRFLNAGVAEQNMTGVAAGLAASGYHVFTYSIANFPTFRCLEQIRNDVCYHDLPVTVVAVGAGLAYGNLGYSHHAVQDIGILRTLPELVLLSPADPGETRACVRWLAEHPAPSYLRVGKAGEPNLVDEAALTPLPRRVRAGEGPVALAATGSVLRCALEAAALLQREGREVPVFSCPWLQPVGEGWIAPLSGFRDVVCVEEHVGAGGFGSLVSGELPPGSRAHVLSLPAAVTRMVGSQDYLRRQAGLQPEAIAVKVRRAAS